MPASAPIPSQLVAGADLVRRLRWVVVAVILVDLGLTYLGQPKTYWADPSTVDEGNRLFHLTMSQGYPISFLIDAVYVVGCVVLVTILPWRLGLTFGLALVLGHFFGGSTWLCFRFQFGAQAMIGYAVVLAVALVAVGSAAFNGPRRHAADRSDA